MRSYYYFFVLMMAGVGLFSCQSGPETEELVARGGKRYGGEFRFMSPEKVTNFLPLASIDVYTQRINDQMFESLLCFETGTMKLKPCVAESFEISDDAKTYTFHIRSNVFFHPDDCFDGEVRSVTAADVKFSLDLACSGLSFNEMSYLLTDKIRGAKKFNESTRSAFNKEGVSGIRAIDAQTLQIELKEPYIGFDKILAHSNLAILAPEAFERYGNELSAHPVGTGPFMMERASEDEIILKRNPNYWQSDDFGNQLPFLDRVRMTLSKEKRSELIAFRKGEIDMVLEIPVEETDNILGTLEDAKSGKNIKHKVESKSSLSINYIGFACESEEFSDPRVRRAFHYALDNQRLVEHYLEGEGNANVHGFVPAMQDYPVEQVNGITCDPVKARHLLQEAGYSDGSEFGTISFYVNGLEGSTAHKLALGIRDQLQENLGVELEIRLCSYEEREAAIASGKAKMWRSGWVADYPDPENFLFNFYSKSTGSGTASLNPFHFKNALFDSYFDKAMREVNLAKRNEYWVKCDRIIVEESPVIPVLTDDFIIMINARVRNFQSNAMEVMDFSAIFIKELK